MFATDRDLWILEPRLFDDIAFSAQTRLLDQPCTVASSSQRLVFTGIDLEDLAITPGMVVALSGYGRFEVTQVESSSALGVSRLRHASDAPTIPIPAPDDTQTSATILTFAPQLELAHRGLLALLGIEPGEQPDPPQPDTPYASQITNPHALVRAEALSTLHLIYAAASALAPSGTLHSERAEMYAERAASERQRLSVHLDLNHDGLPDTTRSPSTKRLRRA
ncbi:MAG: hypothetical protein ACF8MJ_10455 [Phycisphaerales bacterium JB050]